MHGPASRRRQLIENSEQLEAGETDSMMHAVAPIHKFLGGGAKKFYDVEIFFFAQSCQKFRIITP